MNGQSGKETSCGPGFAVRSPILTNLYDATHEGAPGHARRGRENAASHWSDNKMAEPAVPITIGETVRPRILIDCSVSQGVMGQGNPGDLWGR